MNHEHLAAQRRSQLLQALDGALPTGQSVALLDIPHFANVGDNAILLGELAVLRALGRRVLHIPTLVPAYDRDRLRKRIGPRPILLHGGGNLGDLWPTHQQLRERLLTDFPDHPIVQLPQSIAFSSDDSIERARRAFANHRALTLLVRDKPSLAFAASRLGTAARLVPDAAFGLGTLHRRRAPTRDLLVLARTDHEAKDSRRLPNGVTTEDWVIPRLGRRGDRTQALAGMLDRRHGRRPAATDALACASMWAWTRVSSEHLRHGLDLLSSARVVVTDRLHAHVLSLLLGVPHVVTDSVSGKIRGVYDAWTRECELVTWADSLEQGLEVGRELAKIG